MTSKIQMVLADEERLMEAKDAGDSGKADGKRKKPLSSKTNVVTKAPKATKRKGGPAKGGPEIVKVVRPPIVVAHQQQKKARRNPTAAADPAPTQRNPAVRRRDTVHQRGYHNGHENGAVTAMGDDFDDEDFVVPKPSESEIRQFEHEQHQRKRAERSKHQLKNRLSRRTRNKIVNQCIEENGAELKNNIVYYHDDYSPIKPVCMHNNHFSPNPGSPPLLYPLPAEFLHYFYEEEEEEEEEAEEEEDYEEEENYEEEEEEEEEEGDCEDELNWYADRFYMDL